ncbi:MAG: MATE family efflux transporter, partial [Oscillospiraceae bacterium]|nr:MATE family efflux transporter [Oscillospiraceae bacterium]
AGTSLVGQNLGRERPDISIIYGKVSQRVALCISAVMFIILTTLRVPLASLFTDEAHIIQLTSELMLISAFIQIFQTSSTVITGCLRGSGDTKFVAITMIICVTLLRPILSLIAINVLGLGLHGAWFATLIDIIVRFICSYLRFSSSKWTKIKV